MSGDRDTWDDLLARLADGGEVDWERARGEDPAGAGRVQALEDVARIAEFSRQAQREPAPAAGPRPWGPLLLLERIGAGTSGDVWRAWDPALERELAVKMLRAGIADPAALRTEGRALAQVRHPNVVTVHGLEEHDGRFGLRMDLVRGVTLEHELSQRGALPVAEAMRLAQELFAALAAVHAAGVLHRDVKPANLVRDAGGRWVLADFGLGVKQAAGEPALQRVSGTPLFMPPECLDGAPASARSDLWAAGVTVWWALTGAPPFAAGSFDELRSLARRGPDAALLDRVAGVPGPLRAALLAALSPVPATPPASAATLTGRLAAGVEPAPARRRRATVPLAIAAIVLALAVPLALRMRRVPAPVPAPPAPVVPAAYGIQATLVRHDAAGERALADGDRVRPGDRLTLDVHATSRVWVYVVDGDERGETWLLFPQPLFDVQNPILADRDVRLPGSVGGQPSGWTVTSRGGREHVLVVASPKPVPELERALASLPAPSPARPVDYARVEGASLERLRGMGGVRPLPQAARTGTAPLFEQFRALAGREDDVRGTWVRQLTLENPEH